MSRSDCLPGEGSAVSFSNQADSVSASEVLGESGISAGHTERQDPCWGQSHWGPGWHEGGVSDLHWSSKRGHITPLISIHI